MGDGDVATLKKLISDNQKSITNIVSVIRKTGSEALIDDLNKLESEKLHLSTALNELETPLKGETISKADLKVAFEKARKMLKDGSLQNRQEIIDKYVDVILIYNDRVEVVFNFGLGEHEKKIPQNQPSTSDSAVFSEIISTQNVDITIVII